MGACRVHRVPIKDYRKFEHKKKRVNIEVFSDSYKSSVNLQKGLKSNKEIKMQIRNKVMT